MSAIDDLLHDIFAGLEPVLYPEFEGWVRGSRRFREFATQYRTKIRAKLRNARYATAVDDLYAELETAALLLREERFAVEYETYAARKQRGPDYTVTFKTHTPFNVEVRRMRGVDEDQEEARANRLAAVLLDKVGQMPPGIANLLWLIPDAELPAGDIACAALALRKLAEGQDELFFTRRGFSGAADFLRQYARLSGVVLRLPDGIDSWPNPSARHKAPAEIVLAIRRLL